MDTTLELQPQLSAPPPHDGAALERRPRLLAWGGNAWHVVEFATGVGAGIAADSVALVGFGIDSAIRRARRRRDHLAVQRRPQLVAQGRVQQLIDAGNAILVAYIGVEATRDLLGAHHPKASWIGIGLAIFTAPTMPLLARAKGTAGRKLKSSATVSEASQKMICAYLLIALLPGLLANELLGWWWADPPPHSSSPLSPPKKAATAGAATAATRQAAQLERERAELVDN